MLLCGLTDKDLRRICRSQYEHPGSAIGYWPEMSLGHVYIVLEPVGSARLTFDDDRYYEFMSIDVPKVVRSPGWDHGHDEESRNVRDIKIDILDGYIRTPEVYRKSFGFIGNAGEGYRNPYERGWSIVGLKGKREAAHRAGRRPHLGFLVGLGLGGRHLSYSFPPSSFRWILLGIGLQSYS